MNKYEQNLIFWQLLLYGVHIGHRFRNSTLYSGWFVFTYTYKTLIINLYKTILGFRNGNVGYDFCTKFGAPIWFLNLNRAFDIYTSESALRCGEFAYTTYWIHGMISNWLHLADQINQLWHYTEDAHKGQFKKLEMDYSPWFLSRWSWPRSVLITSVHTSEWPSHECLVSRTPSVGIVDTNISGHISNIATPGNDDSIDTIVYYNTSSSQYILEKKYGSITGWLHHVRNSRRNISFADWVLRYFIHKKKIGLHLQEKKLLANIKQREKRNKMGDYMFNVIRFNININRYWGYGIKFFFSLGSGEKKFQGSLDLYSPDGEDDHFKIYSLVEKFKKRGFFICKILNYYLLKRIWNKSSSYIVRKKYMSHRWFKFRFLTCAYYKKEWFDDYYRTNFLVNRFWRNRIFKTFFRWSGFRRSKFAMKFFKFYNVYRYNKKRGFMDRFSSSYLNVSSFASVAFSFGFGYFKKHFYNRLINNNSNSTFLKITNKKITMMKWFFFKKAIMSDLVKYLYNNTNKFLKFSYFFKTYGFLKNKLKHFVYMIYSYMNFYLTFRYHNKNEYLFLKRTKRYKIVKLFRALQHLCKFPRYLEFFHKSAMPYKRLQYWFFDRDIDVLSYDLLDLNAAKVFAMLTLNYRKRFFGSFLRLKNKRVTRIKKYWRKLKWKISTALNRNWVIDTLDYKYDRFKDTEEVRRKVKNLHKKVRKNLMMDFFSEKYNIKFNKKSSFYQVFNIGKKKNKLALKLMNSDASRFNARDFNFFQVTKKFYNQRIQSTWFRALSSLKNEDIWRLEDTNDTRTPSLFFKLFSKSKNPTNDMISSHNLPYFNEYLVNYTFYNVRKSLEKLNKIYLIKWIKTLGDIKLLYHLKKSRKLQSFIKKYINKYRTLRGKHKSLVRKLGRTYRRYITGNKLFYNLKFNKLWSVIKNNFFIEKGFDLRVWDITWNQTLIKKKKYSLLRYSYLDNNHISNFTYFFFIRFFNIYSKQLNLLKHNIITYNITTTAHKKSRYIIYMKNFRKIYWY